MYACRVLMAILGQLRKHINNQCGNYIHYGIYEGNTATIFEGPRKIKRQDWQYCFFEMREPGVIGKV